MRRLNEEVSMIKDYTKKSTIYTMLNEICPGGFKCNMTKKSPKTLAAMINEDKIIEWSRASCFLRTIERQKIFTRGGVKRYN